MLLFILLNNLIGLLVGFPGLDTPTGEPAVPLGIAVLTFRLLQLPRRARAGAYRLPQAFAGPLWWLAPLMFPVEIVSHLARMMSLTIRLYANMLASDLLTLICFSLVPLLFPTVFLGLHLRLR